MKVKNALIFPCGSECGLEIHQALQYEKYVIVYGASSEPNNAGPFVYENYISDPIPYISAPDFIPSFNSLLKRHSIDFIFPTLDSAALYLTRHQKELSATVVSSPYSTNYICRSKKRTYEHLNGLVRTPTLYDPDSISAEMFPLFIKPDIGQGSQGTALIKNLSMLQHHISCDGKKLVMEYLPGKEYTIDCFTNRHGKLLFAGGRERRRIKAGIAVNSVNAKDKRFVEWAKTINDSMPFRGGWFFQVKEDKDGEFVLMEAATRIAGTSALARNRGVNLPLLSFYDAMNLDVSILENDLENEIDRTFVNRFRLGYEFDTVYCDFDDCLVIRNKINTDLLHFLYQCLNEKKQLILLTRHAEDIEKTLTQYRLGGLFDKVIHIKDKSSKAKYMKKDQSIFIDDSHHERLDAVKKGIPSYSPCTIRH
ncbi:ATP-grasp domain-containing protein [Pontiella sp.]|uniref:ATP-grasp domain-containing protein n=1 Tax=Pontiella sp. TaxID=2837462 RepID=UPI003561890E